MGITGGYKETQEGLVLINHAHHAALTVFSSGTIEPHGLRVVGDGDREYRHLHKLEVSVIGFLVSISVSGW